MLYQASTRYLTAGLVTNDKGIVIEAAPILRWMLGKQIDYCERWLEGKDGTLQALNPS